MQRSETRRAAPPWDDVRLFLALARARTVGEAGRTMGVDASTISRRLTTLEETLGATLFDRGRDGVAKTKAAEDLLPVAEEIEAAMTRFSNAADSLERDVSGLVRITCPPDFAKEVIAPRLAELFARHPRLRIDLVGGEALLDLTRREADLALRTVRPTQGDLLAAKVATLRWVPAAAPKLAHALGTVRALASVPWIGWGERFAGIPPARWLATHAKGAEPIVRADSLMVQLGVAESGVGALLAPEPSLGANGLVRLKLGAPLRAAAAALPEDALWVVTHRALRDVPRVKVVWDLLAESAAEAVAPLKKKRSAL